MAQITLSSDQIWLKGKGTAGQVWTPTLSTLPAGAIINSVTLSFVSGHIYSSPGRTEIFWGSEAIAANRLWYISNGSGDNNRTTISLTGRVTGNGSFSLFFRKIANSAGSASNVYFSDISIVVDYTNPLSTFTLNKTTLDAGTALGVTISRADSIYTHKVTYAFGTRSYTQTGVGTSASYTIPLAWLDQIPNAVSGTGSVTVETLNSAGASMGSRSSNFTLTAGAGVVPSAGTLTAALVNGLSGAYIQGHSKCKATLSGYKAGTGATVAAVSITGNGDSANANTLTSSLLRTAGTVTFTATVRDSRGRTASTTAFIKVTAFTDVAITGKTVLRCGSDGTEDRTGGKSAKLGCSYSYTAVTGNSVTVQVFWRVAGAAAWNEITGWDSTSGYTAVALVDSVPLDARYEIRFLVADAVSRAEQTAVIDPGEVFMVWSKVRKCLGLGTYPTGEKRLALAEDWGLWLGEHRVGAAARNLLDNSNFEVNQRDIAVGQSALTTAYKYKVDRWKAFTTNTTGSYFALTAESNVAIAPPSAATDGNAFTDLMQNIKNYSSRKGKTYTFAANIVYRSVASTFVTTFQMGGVADGIAITPNAKAQFFSVDGANVLIRIHNDGSGGLADELLIKWTALYEGEYTAENLPPYIPKGYGVELTECLRYFERVYDHIYFSAAGRVHYSIGYTLKQEWPTITLAKTNNVSGLNVSFEAWNNNKAHAGGQLGTATGEGYWYGCFDVSAEL